MQTKSFLAARSFGLYAIWQLVAIVGVLFPTLLPLYLLGMALFVVLLVIDFKTLLADESFSGMIEGPGAPELGSSVRLRGKLGIESTRSIRATSVSVAAPQSLRLGFQAKHFSTARSTLSASEIGLSIHATARSLGYEELRTLRLLIRSRAGLWVKRLQIDITPYAFRVTPGLKKMPEESFTEMVSSQRILFQGSRLIMRGRTVDQFHSIRKYHYPDSIRHLDHKKTAKFGQLMTRTYESYHSHHMVLALDVGRAMLGQIRGSPKHDYYLSASLALAHAAVEAGDRVSFLAFSQTPHMRITKVRSVRSFQPIHRGDAAIQPREEDSNYAILGKQIAEFSGQRAIVLVLTDLSHPFVQDSLLKCVPTLCRTHLTVVLSLLDRSYDVPTVIDSLGQRSLRTADFARLLYSYWINQRLELFGRKMSSFGGGALSISEEYWMQSSTKVYSLLRTSVKA